MFNFNQILGSTGMKVVLCLVIGWILASFLGVFGASALWGIGELFHQRKRVLKGWFPMNPKRKHDYNKA